jgi:hypothetical protein
VYDGVTYKEEGGRREEEERRRGGHAVYDVEERHVAGFVRLRGGRLIAMSE